MFLSIILIYRFSNFSILLFFILGVLFFMNFRNVIISNLSHFELFNSISERTRFDELIDLKVILFGSGIINVYSPLPVLNFIYGFGIIGSIILLLFFRPSLKIILVVLLIYSLVPRFGAVEAMLGVVFMKLLDNCYKERR